MPNIFGEERPSKSKGKKKPTPGMLGAGTAKGAAKLLGSRQQQIESAVNSIGEHKPRKQ